MNKYYLETKWDAKRGRDICWVFERGNVQHFATFYDAHRAEEYIAFLESNTQRERLRLASSD